MATKRRPHLPPAGPVPDRIAAALRRTHPAPGPAIPTGGLSGRQHPDTSLSAGARDRTPERHAIRRYFYEVGPDGATAADLVFEGLASSVQLAGARLHELRGDRVGFPRSVGRLIDPDGLFVTRRRPGYGAGIVHVHVLHETDLDAGFTLSASSDRVPCGHCGHVRRVSDRPAR